jgi:ATP-dependent protease Clp ATPase subunit
MADIKHCTFCDKNHDEVFLLVQCNTAAICDECIELSRDVVAVARFGLTSGDIKAMQQAKVQPSTSDTHLTPQAETAENSRSQNPDINGVSKTVDT